MMFKRVKEFVLNFGARSEGVIWFTLVALSILPLITTINDLLTQLAQGRARRRGGDATVYYRGLRRTDPTRRCTSDRVPQTACRRSRRNPDISRIDGGVQRSTSAEREPSAGQFGATEWLLPLPAQAGPTGVHRRLRKRVTPTLRIDPSPPGDRVFAVHIGSREATTRPSFHPARPRAAQCPGNGQADLHARSFHQTGEVPP